MIAATSACPLVGYVNIKRVFGCYPESVILAQSRDLYHADKAVRKQTAHVAHRLRIAMPYAA